MSAKVFWMLNGHRNGRNSCLAVAGLQKCCTTSAKFATNQSCATLLPYHLDLYGKISGMLALRRRRCRRQQRATSRDASSLVRSLRVWKGVVVISTMFGQFGNTATGNWQQATARDVCMKFQYNFPRCLWNLMHSPGDDRCSYWVRVFVGANKRTIIIKIITSTECRLQCCIWT